MDINRSSDLRVPSGLEVESASLHEPPASGIKAKLVGMKSKVRSQSRLLTNRVSTRSRDLTTNARQSLRANPAKWAGIAAGVGIGLGIIGRIARHQMAKRARPELVIIEAC